MKFQEINRLFHHSFIENTSSWQSVLFRYVIMLERRLYLSFSFSTTYCASSWNGIPNLIKLETTLTLSNLFERMEFNNFLWCSIWNKLQQFLEPNVDKQTSTSVTKAHDQHFACSCLWPISVKSHYGSFLCPVLPCHEMSVKRKGKKLSNLKQRCKYWLSL